MAALPVDSSGIGVPYINVNIWHGFTGRDVDVLDFQIKVDTFRIQVFLYVLAD